MAAFMATLAIGGPAAGAECARAADQSALRTRVVQTEFMVAALSCGARERYNAFVIRFRPQLVREGKNLQAFFKRAHGSKATAALNAFITKLANLSSERSLADRRSFCADVKQRMSKALAREPAEFAALIDEQPVLPIPGVTFCPIAAAQP